MSKKIISKNEFDFLKVEMDSKVEEGLMTAEEAKNLLSSYEIEKGEVNIIQIFLIFGAFIFGLGVLGAIVTGWSTAGSLEKVMILTASMLGFNVVSNSLENKYPKTARSIRYLDLFTFVAAMYFVWQAGVVHLSSDTFILIATIVIYVVGFVLKDNLILAAGTIPLMFISQDNLNMLWILPLVYFLSKLVYQEKLYNLYVFFLNTLMLYTICGNVKLSMYEHIGNEIYPWYTYLLMSIGLLMAFVPLPEKAKNITRIQGNLLHGLTVIFYSATSTIHPVVMVMYTALLLYMILRGSKLCILMLIGTILSYYLPYLYDVVRMQSMSTIFIISGVLLVIIGFILEFIRKKRKEKKNEE